MSNVSFAGAGADTMVNATNKPKAARPIIKLNLKNYSVKGEESKASSLVPNMPAPFGTDNIKSVPVEVQTYESTGKDKTDEIVEAFADLVCGGS